MKILYVANIRLPTEKAHGIQIMKTCEALGAHDAAVDLIVPRRVNHLNEDPFEYYQVKKSFRISFIQMPDFIRWGSVGFMLNAVLFSELVKWRKLFRSADIIYSRDASVLLQYILLGKKTIYEAHTKPTMVSILAARFARRVVTISTGLADEYIKKGIDPERVIVAPDAIDIKKFETTFNPEKERKNASLPLNKKIVLYVGKLDAAKGVEILAQAQKFLSNEVQVCVIGDGPLRSSLIEHYPNVRALPPTRYADIAQVLSIADVLVIPNSSSDIDASVYTSPIKLFAYLASGIPIVASDVSALREVVSEEEVFFFTPDNPKSLADAVSMILVDYASALQKSTKARALANEHTWEKRAKVIYNALDAVCSKK